MNKLFFDEREADHKVIRSLLKALNRRYGMLRIFQDAQGLIYKAHEFEELGREEAEKLLKDFEDGLALVKEYLARLEAKANPPADTTLANGGDNGQDNSVQASTDNSAPATPASDPNESVAGTNPAPTDQPASDQNQVSDPNAANGNPAPANPAPDLNLAQPQSEQSAMSQIQ
jgi:hypothetical protein